MAIGLAASACHKKQAPALPPPVVEVSAVALSEIPFSSTLIGQLDSPQNVEVRARVEGFVDRISFTEGTEVREGDLLFQLDRRPFQERLAAAQGALAEAEAALNKYQKDVARLTPLAEKRAIPRQDLDNALASVEVGEAGVGTARARVESAQLDLGYCEIKAPVAGMIGAKQVSIGDLVGKGEPTLLATISTLDPIWFYCSISEVEYIRAQERSRALGRDIGTLSLTLITPDGRDHPEKGRFVFIDRAVDPKTGTLRVRAEFANPGKLLRPGMFARVRVDLGTRKNCIVIPERAAVSLQGRYFIWVVAPDGTAAQRPVGISEQVGQDLVVSEGLSAGDRLVIEGQGKLREGAAVKAMTAAEIAAFKAKAAGRVRPD